MHLIVGTLRLAPGTLAAARPAVARTIAGSRPEPGLIRATEPWDDRAALDPMPHPRIAQWGAARPSPGLQARGPTPHDSASPAPT